MYLSVVGVLGIVYQPHSLAANYSWPQSHSKLLTIQVVSRTFVCYTTHKRRTHIASPKREHFQMALNLFDCLLGGAYSVINTIIL